MPELPEVETVRNILEPQLKGRTIVTFTVPQPKVLAHPAPDAFRQGVEGAAIADVGRRGKYLLFRLSNKNTVVMHLRMTGQALVTPPDFPLDKHTHVIFELNNATQLRFVDMRRFGRLWLLGADEADVYTGMPKLGAEPFDAQCCAEYLIATLGKRKKAIKQCLLDQEVVAGIGNIYSDEILHAVKIHPARAACTLTKKEWRALAEAIPAILKSMIAANLISPEEYLETQGKEYRNTPAFHVYGRKGLPCLTCGTPLERSVIGGRSSVWCPKCQRSRTK